MRLIHAADMHLDSKMTANLNKEKAKERKSELLLTFQGMVNYAVENNIDGILIAGDLFDGKVISATARNTVLKLIYNNPGLMFYYLKGNHDKDNFLSDIDELPGNLKLFGDSWTEYRVGEGEKVSIFGAELLNESSQSLQEGFAPDPARINIVMLHGQEAGAVSKDKAEIINIKAFKNKGINYLALGHVHSYKRDELDGAGVYCYAGCLEGRGFDECGDHGFVVLDIDEERGTVKDEFVSFARRRLYTIEADVSGLNDSMDILTQVKTALTRSGASCEDLIKVVLTGDADIEGERDTALIAKTFEDDFYFIKVYDETKLRVDYESFLHDESLKGEFVRTVYNSDLSEEDKASVIMYGFKAIQGGIEE